MLNPFNLFKKSNDSYDEILNRMLRRTLHGEIIPFDEFLDAVDDLAEEPEETPSEMEMQNAANGTKWFLEEMRRQGFPTENRFLLCQNVYEKALSESSLELLRLLCYIVCDTGVLLDLDPELHSPEQDAVGWRNVHQDAEKLYAHLSTRKQLSARFRDLLKRTRFVTFSEETWDEPEQNGVQEQMEQVLNTYASVFYSNKASRSQLSRNITFLIQAADSNTDLTAIKPLFLYRALTRHRKRLETAVDLRMDFHALWSYKLYKIDDDNGKNYQTYAKYLALFEELYRLYAIQDGVDATLCLYGFDRLSNLGDFYRMYPEERQTLPLFPSVEDLFLGSMFTCFEHGYGDNVMLEKSGLSSLKLERFLCGKDTKIQSALEKIETYMNQNNVDLTVRFLESVPEQVPALCEEILEKSELADEQKNKRNTALFLAAINYGLMEASDSYAEDYLIRACKRLIGEETDKP